MSFLSLPQKCSYTLVYLVFRLSVLLPMVRSQSSDIPKRSLRLGNIFHLKSPGTVEKKAACTSKQFSKFQQAFKSLHYLAETTERTFSDTDEFIYEKDTVARQNLQV